MSRSHFEFTKEDEQILKSIAIKLGVTFVKEYLGIMIYKLSNIEVKKGVLENESTNTFQSRENK